MIEPIGESATASVWKAHQESLDRVVAVKTLRTQYAHNSEDLKHAIREAQSAAALKHPNLVQVYDITGGPDSYHLVMEYINGKSVGELLSSVGTLPPPQALAIARYTAEALEYAWDQAGLIHRNVNPGKILIDADGTVKLSDLGLAELTDAGNPAGQHEGGDLRGAQNYISPEQVHGERDLDFRCDIYGLGASLYYMVTGRVPFGESDSAEALPSHRHGQLPDPRDLNPSLQIGVAQLISRMMMRNREDRFESWREAIAAIKHAEAGRIMVGGNAKAGNSMVAPPRNAADRAGKIRLLRHARARRVYSSIPDTFRKVAWSAMIALWVLVGWRRLQLPDFSPIPEKAPPASTAVAPAATPIPASPSLTEAPPLPAHPEPIDETPEPSLPEPQPVPLDEPEAATADLLTPVPAEEELTIPNVPSAPVEEPEPITTPDGGLAPYMRVMLESLKKEDFAEAQAVIQGEMSQPHSEATLAKLRSIQQLLIEVADVPHAIEKEFVLLLGTEITINADTTPLTMVLRSVVSGKITAEVKAGYNKKRSFSFMIDQLNPAERSRWVPGRSHAANTMRCILYMKAGNMDAAREVSVSCGPLAEVFRAVLTGPDGGDSM